MRNRIALVLIALFSASLFVAAQNGNIQDKPEGEKKIAELKKERFEILTQRVEALESQYKQGDIQIMKVIHAKEDVYQAQLAMDTVPKERVELLKLRLQNMKQLEEVSTQRFSVGVGSLDDKFVGIAARIQAEIDLLNEETKLK